MPTRRALATALVIALVHSPLLLASEATLDEATLAAAGPYQVLIVHSPLDEDVADELTVSTGAAALSGLAGAAVTTAGMASAATSMTIGSTTYYSTAATLAAPVAVLIGAGAFAGAVQQKRAERREAQRFAVPIQQRAAAAHAEERLDQLLEDSLARELGSVAWLVRAGPITTLHAEGSPWEAAFEAPRKQGARSLLVISVAARLPDSLAGYYRNVEVRIYSDALPKRAMAWSKYGRFAWSSGESALVNTPVPLVDIGRKPQEWIEERSEAVRTKYDALISASKNKDTQRELRTRRNAELDRVTGPWRLTQLAEYMAPHWAPPDGDRYAALVRDGQQDLAKLVTASLSGASRVASHPDAGSLQGARAVERND